MDKYREEIKKILGPLSDAKRILFAALICKRLYPNYQYFYNAYKWGNPKVLDDAMNMIFQSVFKKDLFEKKEILSMIDDVELITPHTEQFSEIYVSFALDACTAVLSTLNYILEQELDHIVDVATYARDTVDMFIQERDNISSFTAETENRISNDPLMLTEKKRQIVSIERMLSKDFGDAITDQLIDSLQDNTPIIDIENLES